MAQKYKKILSSLPMASMLALQQPIFLPNCGSNTLQDRLNAKITGKEVPMKKRGQTAYRCLIPMKDILEDEDTKFLFENQPPGFWAPALPAKGVMAVTYPCRDNQILNVLAVHRKLGQHATGEDDV